MTARAFHPPRHSAALRISLLALALLLLILGAIGLGVAHAPSAPTVATLPTTAETLRPGTVATLASAPFAYSPGWTVTSAGADPGEPADPWTQPAGVLTFSYTGADLLMQLAQGNYWGYFYVTVDGAPANRLSVIRGNTNQQGERAGYRTLYAPELHSEDGPTPQWVLVHRAADPTQLHEVRVEVWRSWGQTPLRAIAIDAQTPQGLPRWPFVAALLLGFGLALYGAGSTLTAARLPGAPAVGAGLTWLTAPVNTARARYAVALLGTIIVAGAIWLRLWWMGPLGLALLGYASLRQPALWAAALLFALPFYYSQTLPILPGRATNLIDVGVLGGLLTAIGAWFIALRTNAMRPSFTRPFWPIAGWLFALAAWSLISASAAHYDDIALREWRTVFLAAALFALLLGACRADPNAPQLLVLAWIAGGVAIALIGLGQFATDAMLIEAEGVSRVRSLYGSPNNLALYLERTLMPTLALLLLLPNGARRWLTLAAALVQGGVLLLTFSKGALILGLPAGLVALWLGGLVVLRRQRASTRPLWWLAAAAGVALLALLPFLGTERFQRLLDFNSGTGFTRLQLWRSSLHMALDHWWLGVGPDNFLYTYRSQYILPAAWQEPDLNHPHTWLLDWWTRLGLVGMLLGLGWWGAGLRATWQRLHEAATGPHAALWLGTLAAMIAALCHGLIDLSYAVPDLMLVWVLLTLLPTMGEIRNK